MQIKRIVLVLMALTALFGALALEAAVSASVASAYEGDSNNGRPQR